MNNLLHFNTSAERGPRHLNPEGVVPLERRAAILKAIVGETEAAIKEIERTERLHIVLADPTSVPHTDTAVELARPALSAMPAPIESVVAERQTETPVAIGSTALIDDARSQVAASLASETYETSTADVYDGTDMLSADDTSGNAPYLEEDIRDAA